MTGANNTALATIVSAAPAVQQEQTVVLTMAPGPSEWASMVEQATRLSRTSFVPAHYRSKPDELLACWMAARELRIGPMLAMRKVAMINGTPSLEAELMVALVRRDGHQLSGTTTTTGAKAWGKRRDTGEEMEFEFAEADAKAAKLAGEAMYGKYPKSMYWARAVSQLCRMLFPDCLAGFSYTPEEAREINAPSVRPAPEPLAVEQHQQPTAAASEDQAEALYRLAESLPEPKARAQIDELLGRFSFRSLFERVASEHERQCGADCPHLLAATGPAETADGGSDGS